MTLINTLILILHHYLKVFSDTFSHNSPIYAQTFRIDCESLVERYNSLLEDISSYMRNHSKVQENNPEISEISLAYHDSDSFYFISIKDDLAILTGDCKQLLEEFIENPVDSQLHNEAIEQYLNQLQELRKYSVQIETALHEYEEKIMKIEEEISNNTLCN